MNIGTRLEAVGKMVLEGSILADIGTDHAYLPVWLLKMNKIKAAIAGDIAEGPCMAARNTVAIYGMKDKVEVRLGSGLQVLTQGEADCIAIAGMGASTMIDILTADLETAKSATRIIFQPMAGAASLRRWLIENGWLIAEETLVEEGNHLYEVISAERGEGSVYTNAEYEIGPLLIANKHILLAKQFKKQIGAYEKMLNSMSKSSAARDSDKYKEITVLLKEMEELAHECDCK